MGLLKPIYRSDVITICNVSDYCYYMIYNEPGIAINIRPDAFMESVEDPMSVLELYTKMAYKDQRKISFVLGESNSKKVLIDVREKVRKAPSVSIIDHELERQIIEKSGDPNI